MLRDLYIKNLAVLEEATIDFGEGLNILSGETGAGKSIVVDSLALLAGVRASGEMIRTGAEELVVTGIFEPRGESWRGVLAGAGLELESEEMLVVRREIQRSGRNRVFLNDRPVTLKLLTDLAPSLLRIHGQREELGLVAPELQRTWLDRSGGEAGKALLARVATAYASYRGVAERLERLTGDDRARQERLDLLRFQLSEIGDAQVEAGEEDKLRQERDVLRNSEAIQKALATAGAVLFDEEGAAYEAIGQARHALEEAARWESQAAEWATELEEIHIRLGEIETDLGRRRDEIEADPRRLDAVEDRLALLERLLRKYGDSSAEILAHADRISLEIDELESDEATLEEIEEEVAEALETYREAAVELSKARRAWAKRLGRRVEEDLKELAFDKARFAVLCETRAKSSSPLLVGGEPVEFGELGVDHVIFMFSPNPGEELRPLARVASGGELSRLYLAVQLAARGEGGPGSSATLVFDEVDAGISGAEAATLGRKLRRLARGGQILCVTHLPQVASCADVHFKVKKEVRDGRTFTAVDHLESDRQVEEVARMLAGSELTELSLSHARELIAGAV